MFSLFFCSTIRRSLQIADVHILRFFGRGEEQNGGENFGANFAGDGLFSSASLAGPEADESELEELSEIEVSGVEGQENPTEAGAFELSFSIVSVFIVSLIRINCDEPRNSESTGFFLLMFPTTKAKVVPTKTFGVSLLPVLKI